MTDILGLRDEAELRGLNVGYDKGVVTINGQPINVSGLTNYGEAPPTGYNANTYYGTSDQINSLLSPFQNPSQPGDYVQSPEVQGALDDYNEWMKKPYASQYAPQIENLVRDVMSRQFKYDPAKDAQFQRASKELTRNVLETMNERGILNSSITENQVQQGIADMMPQYQELARNKFMDEGKLLMSQVDMLAGLDQTGYNRYMDEGEKYLKALDVVNRMDENQYSRWKDAFETRYRQYQDTYNVQLNKVEERRNKIKDAWERTSELGYVDNQASVILGVPPGTLSKEAREWKEKKEQAELERKQAIEDYKTKAQIDYNMSLKLANAKGSNLSSLGTPQQVNLYNNAFTYLLNKAGGDGYKAYQLLMQDKEYADPKISMGPKLYEQLAKDFQGYGKSQGTPNQLNAPMKSTDYKTDPDFAANVAYINANPDTALQDIMDNSVQLIQDYGIDGYNYLIKLATPKE